MSKKRIFVPNFLLTSYPPSPPLYPLNSQNPLNVTKGFCQCSLTFLLLFVGNHWKPVTKQYIRKESLLFRKVNYWSYFPYVKNVSRIQSTFFIIGFKYKDCGVTGTCKNQEMIGSMAALNLLLSAGLSVSGNKMQFYSKKNVSQY